MSKTIEVVTPLGPGLDRYCACVLQFSDL